MLCESERMYKSELGRCLLPSIAQSMVGVRGSFGISCTHAEASKVWRFVRKIPLTLEFRLPGSIGSSQPSLLGLFVKPSSASLLSLPVRSWVLCSPQSQAHGASGKVAARNGECAIPVLSLLALLFSF